MANENAITKIQLKTKISSDTGDDKVELSEIDLAQGEPLVNTNDKTVIIGTRNGDNLKANDSSAIVLGYSKDEIDSNDGNTGTGTVADPYIDRGITIKHYDGDKENPRYTRTVKGTSADVSSDSSGNITVDATYTLATTPSTSGTSISLKDTLGNEHASNINIATKNCISSTGEDNYVKLEHVEDNQIQSTHYFKTSEQFNLNYDADDKTILLDTCEKYPEFPGLSNTETPIDLKAFETYANVHSGVYSINSSDLRDDKVSNYPVRYNLSNDDPGGHCAVLLQVFKDSWGRIQLDFHYIAGASPEQTDAFTDDSYHLTMYQDSSTTYSSGWRKYVFSDEKHNAELRSLETNSLKFNSTGTTKCEFKYESGALKITVT